MNAAPSAWSSSPSAASSPYWGSDWVVIVTNYDKDLDWLARLPLKRLGMKLVVYIKQDRRHARTCAMLPPSVAPHLFTCREVPNAHGREAHTIVSFFTEFYDKLPRMMLFLQDDCDAPTDGSKGEFSCKILNLDYSPEQLAVFTNKAEARPFDQDTCLCTVVVELNFRMCPRQEPLPYFFREGPGRCYGDRWYQVAAILDLAAPEKGIAKLPHLRWPMYAQFAVPGWAVRQMPQSFWKTSLLLLDGVGANVQALGTSTLAWRTHEIGKEWSSHDWAHAFERAWFGLLDAKYREKLDRDMLLTPASPWGPPQPPAIPVGG